VGENGHEELDRRVTEAERAKEGEVGDLDGIAAGAKGGVGAADRSDFQR